MTQILKGQIECQCKNMVDVELYNSVNVTVNPELLDKVKKRKINNYHCDKCGEKSELSHQFLYVDLRDKHWVWCYPEKLKKDKKEIEVNVKNDPNNELITRLGHPLPSLVFGYDELLNLLGI